MFAIDPPEPGHDMTAAFAEGSFRRVARLGQYGVDYVPSTRDIADLKRRIDDPSQLRRMLMHSDRKGLVVIDTKSDFEILTQSAIDASDLVAVVVKDQASLIEARRVFDRLAAAGRPPEVARVLLSLIDLRIKYQGGEGIDVLGHLVSEIRREGYPLFETFVSRSPKVESLYTNPDGRAVSVLHGAAGTLVHRQMRSVTEEVLKALRLD
jgi:cellulose biosynthesis protein BcsQ